MRQRQRLNELRSEGDLNISAQRAAWARQNIDAETRRWLQEDERYFFHQALSTPCLDVLTGCDGIYLEDLQGRRYMDFHGNNVHQVGFRNRKVIEAVVAQLNTLPFCTRRYTNLPAIKLARKLAELAPGQLNKVLFAPGGTSAIGMALKLARVATGRHKTISMWDSFHGASLDAISIGGEAIFRRDIGPLLPGSEHVPPADPHLAVRLRHLQHLADVVDVVVAVGQEEDPVGVLGAEVRHVLLVAELEADEEIGAVGGLEVIHHVPEPLALRRAVHAGRGEQDLGAAVEHDERNEVSIPDPADEDFETHTSLSRSLIDPLWSMTKTRFIGVSSSKAISGPWMPMWMISS